MLDRGLHVIGRLDELDAGSIEHHAFFQLADVAMGDAPFDHHRSVAERDAEVVEGVELQRERRFDLGAAAADIQDGHGLIDLDLARQRRRYSHAFSVAFVFAGHAVSADYTRNVQSLGKIGGLCLPHLPPCTRITSTASGSPPRPARPSRTAIPRTPMT